MIPSKSSLNQIKGKAIIMYLARRWRERSKDSHDNTGFLIRGIYLRHAAEIMAQDNVKTAPLDVPPDFDEGGPVGGEP